MSPSQGINTSPMPTYTWNAVPNSTWYYLWVDDSNVNRIGQWYKAADAGCTSGTGTCSLTPGTALTVGAGQMVGPDLELCWLRSLEHWDGIYSECDFGGLKSRVMCGKTYGMGCGDDPMVVFFLVRLSPR